jgi:ABC-2 type transport system permease protein
VLSLVGLTFVTAGAVDRTYSTQKAVDAYADSLGSSPSAIALAGPSVALHTHSGVVIFEASFTCLVGTALMAMFLVVRHTRGEEEEGRAELLRSTVLGRHAASAAAFLTSVAASVVVGAGMAAALVTASVPTGAAVLFGAGVTAVGVVFAALSLCAAQLFSHARAALGATLAVLGAAYAVRGAGDVRRDWLVWLSPFGWSQATQPLAADRWWPLLVPVVVTLLLLGVAAVLAEHRDLGAGVVATRPGPHTASRFLSGPAGLAVRLQRGSLLGWSAGVLVLAAVSGTLVREMQTMARDNPTLAGYLRQHGSASPVDSFLATMLLILALCAAASAVSSALRVRAEETSGHVEPLLSTGLSRTRWLCASWLVTAVGSLLVLVAGGLGLGVGYGLALGDPSAPFRLAAMSLVYAPAVLALPALAVLLFGWLPRLSQLTWAVLAVFFVLGWLGGLLRPPGWLSALSPFAHIPQLPAEHLTLAAPAVVAAAVVLALLLAAVGFRRRDVG